MLFVGSSFSTPGGVVQGRVQAFTTDGKPLRFWSTSHVVGGLAFDAGSQTLYFTSGDSPDVFAISPLSDASPRFVGEVNGATKLGSITIDSARHQFYISDVDQSTVFSMSLSTRHVATIGRVGTPSALLMNMSGSQLIVADSARKQVIGLSVGDPNVAPHPLTPPRSFKGPSGLAWEDSSHLIVSDELAGSVTLLDATGKTMYSLTLH